MAFLPRYGALIAGLVSVPASAYLGMEAYRRLTRASADTDQDFVFRLSMVALAMAVPFAVTLVLALMGGRPVARPAKVGLAIASLSLALTLVPLRSLFNRYQQVRNLALTEVTAPAFDTKDLLGQSHRLEDQLGKVVLINVWATWCGPCRFEMPLLDRLYRERKDKGLMVYGFSSEDVALQRAFLEDVPVSYPLLTTNGVVPGMYRDIDRYPATFLIDRKGRLQPAPGPEEPFEKLVASVDALLISGTDHSIP